MCESQSYFLKKDGAEIEVNEIQSLAESSLNLDSVNLKKIICSNILKDEVVTRRFVILSKKVEKIRNATKAGIL